MAKLSVGDKMPNFAFDTAYETGKTIEEVTNAKKRTIFWVLRYISCTTCRYDIHVLAARYREFLALDTQIYVVMQSDPVNVREDLKDNKLPFDIICDPAMDIYHSLDIRATATREERMPTDPEGIARFEEKLRKCKELGIVHGKYEGNEQQLPALFVVDRACTVTYAHYAQTSIDMPTADEMLAILQEL